MFGSKTAENPSFFPPAPALQAKCDTCEQEEKLQKKDEKEELKQEGIQPKLSIGAPDDPYEKQADAVADQVVQRLAAPPTPSTDPEEKLQRKEEEIDQAEEQVQMKPIFESVAPPDDNTVQRKCTACEQEEDAGIQRKESGGETSASPDISSRLQSSKGGGSALPSATRTRMEGAMGADFSGVRVHTGSDAVQMSQDIHAQAFTHGSDVYFNAGKYNPGSGDGDRLLAHELVHTVQQSDRIQTKIWRMPQNPSLVPLQGIIIPWSAALQESPSFTSKTLADIPRGHAVTILGGKAWIKVKTVLGDKLLEGYISHELIRIKRESNESSLQNDVHKGNANDTVKSLTWEETGNLRGTPLPPVREKKNPPNNQVVEDGETYQLRLAAVKNVLAAQKKRAQTLVGKQKLIGQDITDYRYWFAKVYSLVTENEIKFAQGLSYYYPSYVMMSVLYFDKIYQDNFDAWNAGTKIEDHWKTAFEEAKSQKENWWPVAYAAVASLVESMIAHIRFDLPRAEAWVFQSYYSKMPTVKIQNFRKDFMSMSGVFENAGREMMPEIREKTSGSGLGTRMPKSVDDAFMEKWFGAEMGAERADTWNRTEQLVEKGLANDDPYSFNGDRLTGNVTGKDHVGGLKKLTNNLVPNMNHPATIISQFSDESDTEIREKVEKLSKDELSNLPTIIKVVYIIRLSKGTTGDDDEQAILKILYASIKSNDLVEVIDGADAYKMMNSIDFAEAVELRKILILYYYSKTAFQTALRLIIVSMEGETAEWEEEMIVDIISFRIDKRNLVEGVGKFYEPNSTNKFREGLFHLELQLDGKEETKLQTVLGTTHTIELIVEQKAKQLSNVIYGTAKSEAMVKNMSIPENKDIIAKEYQKGEFTVPQKGKDQKSKKYVNEQNEIALIKEGKTALNKDNFVVVLMRNFISGEGPENYVFANNSEISLEMKQSVVFRDILREWYSINKPALISHQPIPFYEKFGEFGPSRAAEAAADGLLKVEDLVGSANFTIRQLDSKSFKVSVFNVTSLGSGDLGKELKRVTNSKYVREADSFPRDLSNNVPEPYSNISQTFSFTFNTEQIHGLIVESTFEKNKKTVKALIDKNPD